MSEIISVKTEETVGHVYVRSYFFNSSFGWVHLPLSREFESELPVFVARQLQAALIALDAAVALTTVTRQPEKLNRARQRRGQLPLYDYHVVSLANRTRPATLPDDPATLPEESAGAHRSPRLHFRRGHWRHFENFKTWINWTLVGDPDLGFIEKHYRL
jgi:hypothetical protein